MYRIASIPGPATESCTPEISVGLLDLLVSVHYKGTVLSHRFGDWNPLKQQNPGGFRTIFDGNWLITLNFSSVIAGDFGFTNSNRNALKEKERTFRTRSGRGPG